MEFIGIIIVIVALIFFIRLALKPPVDPTKPHTNNSSSSTPAQPSIPIPSKFADNRDLKRALAGNQRVSPAIVAALLTLDKSKEEINVTVDIESNVSVIHITLLGVQIGMFTFGINGISSRVGFEQLVQAVEGTVCVFGNFDILFFAQRGQPWVEAVVSSMEKTGFSRAWY